MRTTVLAPLNGKAVELGSVKATEFASGCMGGGVGIIPSDNRVVAPFDGKIEVIYPTKHAIGIVSDDGLEILIHVGVDTIKLQGKGFDVKVEAGDCVRKGDIILEFNRDILYESGIDDTTMVVVANSYDYSQIIAMPGSVKRMISPIFEVVE